MLFYYFFRTWPLFPHPELAFSFYLTRQSTNPGDVSYLGRAEICVLFG